MAENCRIYLFLSVLILILDYGISQKIERHLIEKITEEALKLPFEFKFTEDSRLFQIKRSKFTVYRRLLDGKVIFRRKHSDSNPDSGKDVIVLEENEDHFPMVKEKRIFTVLKRNPDEPHEYAVYFAYIRNALPSENEMTIQIFGEKYKIEWDLWEDRGSRRNKLSALFGWSTCYPSLFIFCKIAEVKNQIWQISEEELYNDNNEVETIGGNNFYPSIDFNKNQINFYLKSIRLNILMDKIMPSAIIDISRKYPSKSKKSISEDSKPKIRTTRAKRQAAAGEFFGGMFGIGRKKRSIAQQRKRDTDLTYVSHHVDALSNLGWTMQEDMSTFANEVDYFLTEGTFTGWGPCKQIRVTKENIYKIKNVQQLVKLLMGLMRTQCDPIARKRAEGVIKSKYIKMTDEHTIVFDTKGLEIMNKPMLNEEETQKLSLSFELVVFSETIVNDLMKIDNLALDPTVHSKINKNAIDLMQYALNALSVARSQGLTHYFLLTRNTALTIQTAVARIVTDLIKISRLPKHTNLDNVLGQDSFNSLFHLIGILKFYEQQGHTISQGIVSDEYNHFMIANYELVLKLTENFTNNI